MIANILYLPKHTHLEILTIIASKESLFKFGHNRKKSFIDFIENLWILFARQIGKFHQVGITLYIELFAFVF